MFTEQDYYSLGFGVHHGQKLAASEPEPGGHRRVAAAAGGGDSVAPRPVSRGAKLPAGDLNVSIDWLRLRGQRERRASALQVLGVFFGKYEPGCGRYGYSRSDRFEAGAGLFWDDQRHECIVDVPGSALGALKGWEVIELIKALRERGFSHPTRMDVAIDYRGKGLALVQAVLAGCKAHELTGSRKFKLHEDNGGEEGLGVGIGKRGKHGSGRYVRVYDKGLETGECEANEWHRFEVEFSQDVASAALGWILQGHVMADQQLEPILTDWASFKPVPGWEISAAQCALGAIDFRENNGRRFLKRRPRCEWWSDVLAGVEPHRVKSRRERLVSLDAVKEWARKQWMPTVMGMARATRRTWEQVISDLAGDLAFIKSATTAAVFEYGQLSFGMSGAGVPSGTGSFAVAHPVSRDDLGDGETDPGRWGRIPSGRACEPERLG